VYYNPSDPPLPPTSLLPNLNLQTSSSPTPPPFLTSHDDSYLSSSVPDLQNVNVRGGGKKDNRTLNGDCWSEFR